MGRRCCKPHGRSESLSDLGLSLSPSAGSGWWYRAADQVSQGGPATAAATLPSCRSRRRWRHGPVRAKFPCPSSKYGGQTPFLLPFDTAGHESHQLYGVRRIGGWQGPWVCHQPVCKRGGVRAFSMKSGLLPPCMPTVTIKIWLLNWVYLSMTASVILRSALRSSTYFSMRPFFCLAPFCNVGGLVHVVISPPRGWCSSFAPSHKKLLLPPSFCITRLPVLRKAW